MVMLCYTKMFWLQVRGPVDAGKESQAFVSTELLVFLHLKISFNFVVTQDLGLKAMPLTGISSSTIGRSAQVITKKTYLTNRVATSLL